MRMVLRLEPVGRCEIDGTGGGVCCALPRPAAPAGGGVCCARIDDALMMITIVAMWMLFVIATVPDKHVRPDEMLPRRDEGALRALASSCMPQASRCRRDSVAASVASIEAVSHPCAGWVSRQHRGLPADTA